MVAPRVFVSSTCYDLAVIRTELRYFIELYGYMPVMSEYSDILYDPRVHTHTSCLQEISSCDMILFIIGSRYGGESIPDALESIDFKQIEQKSTKPLDDGAKLSITQLEIVKGIESEIPIFTFVSSGVISDYHTYKSNKNNEEIINKIIFPNIDKQSTAKYIFAFIDYIQHLSQGNGISVFANLDDIKNHLRKQWAAMFQRFLKEQRANRHEEKELNILSDQIADLKTAIITSLPKSDLGDVARGAIKYRRLIDSLTFLCRRSEDGVQLLKSNISWNELLQACKVVDIKENTSVNGPSSYSQTSTFIILEDNTYFESRYPKEIFNKLAMEWELFRSMPSSSKDAIITAIVEDFGHKYPSIKYRQEDFYITRVEGIKKAGVLDYFESSDDEK